MRRQLIFIVVGIFLACCFLYTIIQNSNNVNKIALEDLNLKLTGVVESVENGSGFHGYGIVRVRILSANILEYDPRGKQKYFFCIIKHGVAEIYDHTSTTNTFIGDTVIYDTKEKKGGTVKKGKVIDEGSIGVNTEDEYYQFIKQKTIFK